MENDRRIETSKYEGHTPAPWESTSDGIVGLGGPNDVTLHLFGGCYSATDALLVADAPKILDELKRCYELIDALQIEVDNAYDAGYANN